MCPAASAFLVSISVLSRQVGVNLLVVDSDGMSQIDRSEQASKSLVCRFLFRFRPLVGGFVLAVAALFKQGAGKLRGGLAGRFRLLADGLVGLIVELHGQ